MGLRHPVAGSSVNEHWYLHSSLPLNNRDADKYAADDMIGLVALLKSQLAISFPMWNLSGAGFSLISHKSARSSVYYGVVTIVGSLKLYVSSAEYCLFYWNLLQKRLIILRSLLIVATPYGNHMGNHN